MSRSYTADEILGQYPLIQLEHTPRLLHQFVAVLLIEIPQRDKFVKTEKKSAILYSQYTILTSLEKFSARPCIETSNEAGAENN
jgi:hypothetical protein